MRESTQSWREVLLSLKDRGMDAPKLAIGDGAMGFRAALEEICPTTPSAAVLAAQNHERAELLSQAVSAEGQGRVTQRLASRNQKRCDQGL